MGDSIDQAARGPCLPTQRGGCECGAVRYELQIDPCTDDIALAPSELVVRAREFKLLCGEDSLSGHQFASLRVHRFYCEQCGVCSFMRHNVDHRGAEFYAVNVLCLDRPGASWGP